MENRASGQGPNARRVARNIERVRTARQLKQSDVARKLKAAGHPMLATVVSKVERGERRIDVDDLVAFGRALNVPPALLLYPLGETDEVEVLPGTTTATWSAYRWFVGEGPFPSEPVPGGEIDEQSGLAEWYENLEEGWEDGAAPILLWKQNAEQVRAWFDAVSQVRRMGLGEDQARAELAHRRARVEAELKTTRRTMRMQGLAPPRLPTEIQRAIEDPFPREEKP